MEFVLFFFVFVGENRGKIFCKDRRRVNLCMNRGRFL